MYQPYNGPAGPSKEQAEGNTRALGEKLKELNIPFREDREWAKMQWGGDDLNLYITKGADEIYVGYDRWGFCADCGSDKIDVDQQGLDETIVAIQKWYNS